MAKTVLIVEDDRNIADLLRLYLEKEGYTVVIAPDGMRGVEQFRTVHPSLVLLDVMLPGLDGWGRLPRHPRRVADADHHAHRKERNGG